MVFEAIVLRERFSQRPKPRNIKLRGKLIPREGFVKRERRMMVRIARTIRRMRARVLEDLRNDGLLREAAPDPKKKLPNVENAVNDAYDADQLAWDIYEESMAEFNLAYGNAAAVYDIDHGFGADVSPHDALDSIKTYADKFASSVVAGERDTLLALIYDNIENGAGPDALRKAIVANFDEGIHRVNDKGDVRVEDLDNWAQGVARTELSRAYNYGSLALYKDAGFERWQWVAAWDERMCPECEEANGQVVEIGQTFEYVDSDQPPAHPGCLCTTVADEGAMSALDDVDDDTRDAAAHGNLPSYGGDDE